MTARTARGNGPHVGRPAAYCPCGALAERRDSLCGKCRSRARWARRKSRHDTSGDRPSRPDSGEVIR